MCYFSTNKSVFKRGLYQHYFKLYYPHNENCLLIQFTRGGKWNVLYLPCTAPECPPGATKNGIECHIWPSHSAVWEAKYVTAIVQQAVISQIQVWHLGYLDSYCLASSKRNHLLLHQIFLKQTSAFRKRTGENNRCKEPSPHCNKERDTSQLPLELAYLLNKSY